MKFKMILHVCSLVQQVFENGHLTEFGLIVKNGHYLYNFEKNSHIPAHDSRTG